MKLQLEKIYTFVALVLLPLALLPLASAELHAAQSVIKHVEVNAAISLDNTTPTLKQIRASTDWKVRHRKSLLTDNSPFLIRIPVDSILQGDSSRILGVISEVTLEIFQRDGSTVKVRDLLTTSELVNDRFSIKIHSSDAVDGFIFALVHPRKGWHPSAQPSNSVGLWLDSTPISEYDILASNFNLKTRQKGEASMLFLLGGIFILGCYFGMLYFSNRKEYIFGIYASYLFFHSIYWAERIATLSIPFFTRNVDQVVVNAVSQICFHIAFTLLAHELLNFRKYYPTLGRIWRLFAVGQLCFAAMFTILMYSGFDPVTLTNVFTTERAFIGFIAIITTFYFVIKPHNIYCYFMGFASFSFVGSALSAMFLNRLDFFEIGLTIEILTFAFAIGHKIRKSDEARIESEKSAFMLEREVIRTKDAALRAQMNPHFVSNVINALRALILDGENQQAYSYLSRFAHVVRTMLGSADKQLIPLSEELRLLKDYVALEELRFRRSVKFLINIEVGIDSEGLFIPPMLLQPLVENAMHHGLFPLTEREPKIVLSITAPPYSNNLRIIVQDNGIGRTKAAETQVKRKRQRPSMAMDIIRERIKLHHINPSYTTLSDDQEILIIEDLVDEKNLGIGTKITLEIPRTIIKDRMRSSIEQRRRLDQISFLQREEKLPSL